MIKSTAKGSFKREYLTQILLKIFTLAIAACALLATFSISDYYIFNRIGEFGVLFCISQWAKKAGLVLLVLAVFYKRKTAANAAKYFLPIFVILSCFLFGDYFNITKIAETPEQEIYNSINLFMPKWLNVTLFFAQNVLILLSCALLFVRDGYKINTLAPVAFIFAMVTVIPLNIFENFFDINTIPQSSPLRFRNFSVWHLLALVFLATMAISTYLYLRNKNSRDKNTWLAAMAVVMLIQYHSKDSVIIGDGYNVYHTLFACIPLFICNIGMYVTALSIFLRKKKLYAISFFIHAVGALSVFIYFAKDEMSDFGIFCSYSFLFFIVTHAYLFTLSIMPTALKQYKFCFKDITVPLIYYFAVIILASISSALVTSYSTTWHTADGYYLPESALLMPNYGFTQINPLPFEVPAILKLRIWKYDLNVLYILALYAVYVAIFFAFIGVYYAILALRSKLLASTHFTRSRGDVEASEVSDVNSMEASDYVAVSSYDRKEK